MNEQLCLLIELQKIDTVILALHSKIDLMPGTITASEGPLKKSEASFENLKQGCAAMEKKKKDREQAIEDINEKIKKLTQRTSGIKNNKEYQAHLKEIEKAERDLKSAEDELLDTIESIEKTSGLLAAEQSSVTGERSKLDVLRQEIEKTIALDRRELKKFKEDRKKFIEKLDPDIYGRYIATMKSGRGLAVVEAKNEICQGCNLHIPPQMFVELKKNEEITLCPQCRRILYYNDSDVASTEAKAEELKVK
ncbi:MAG TPA: C4-type zinc ribbon domain-containing protein [Dissulfurispiraceae bacterium]|nr:C4-type zinc ribbon domain-containing protein [Dissulfurispiraceae bacterium]